MMSSNSENEMGFRPDRLHAAREARGLTQRDLGRLIGVGINQIHRYENGIADPSTPILSAMAHELGITTDYLLGVSDVPQGNTQVDLRADERQLLDAYAVGDGNAVVKLLSKRIELLEAKRSEA